jgi:NitT/TauT family transport system substrate-binding protein
MKILLRTLPATLACAAMLGAGSARAADNITLQLDWVPSGIAAAWFYGVANNCFSAQNIGLKITRGYGAGDAITKVATGSAEFGVTDLGAMIASRAKTGAPVKGVMPIMSDSPFGVAVMDTSPVKTLNQLEGKRVASAAGDAGMQFLPIGMQLAGADFGKINRVTSEPATLAGLLIQEKVDAITTYVTSGISVNQAAMKVGKKIRMLHFGRQLEIYNASVFTSDKVIQENPGLVKRFYDAAVCSHEGSRKNLGKALDAIVEQVSGMQRDSQEELVDFSFKLAFDSPTFAKHGYGWSPERVAHTVEIVKKAQSIDAVLDPATFVYTAK